MRVTRDDCDMRDMPIMSDVDGDNDAEKEQEVVEEALEDDDDKNRQQQDHDDHDGYKQQFWLEPSTTAPKKQSELKAIPACCSNFWCIQVASAIKVSALKHRKYEKSGNHASFQLIWDLCVVFFRFSQIWPCIPPWYWHQSAVHPGKKARRDKNS